MNRLLPLILLCLLLCGCADTALPEETIPPRSSVALEVSEPEEYGGTVQKIPLTLRKVRGLRTFNDKLLLFSGQGSTTLTLMDSQSMEELSRVMLEFPLEAEALRLHTDGTLSFFDPDAEETVVLNEALQEIRRISAPGGLTSPPILAPDGDTLFYCTASHVRAWDLESGIRRCVKEMSSESQILTDVLMDGTVLQCLVTIGGKEESLFLSAKDGRLLHRGLGSYTLLTEDDRYYAAFPAGYNRLLVFGSGDSPARMLFPADAAWQSFFLPEQEGLLTAATQADDRVVISFYDLDSGQRSDTLTLDALQNPKAAVCVSGDLFLLTYDPEEDQDLLYRWEVRSSSEDTASYTFPYYPAAAPDTEGLAQCSREAARLGNRYGIQILIGEEAAETEPWDYDFTAEHLVPLIQRELELLGQRLEAYPEDMLRQTASHFSRLTLCLVRSVTGTGKSGSLNRATGVQFLDDGGAYVVIAAGQFSEQALYHELFHVMETHIFSASKAFDRWNELNPAGFQYDYDYAANAVRDSGVYLFQEHRAFVDTYSMSFPKEDRARIMEYAMLPENGDLFRTDTMQKKLQTLCTGIREAYSLKEYEDPFLWEQYLDK